MDLYPDLEANYTHDHLAVWHKSVDFLKDPRFVEAYRRGMDSGHRIGRPAGSRADIHIEWRVHVLCWAAAHAAHLPGDFVECGVNTGIFSLAAAYYVDFNKLDKSFFLFDTFAGIPEEQITDVERIWERHLDNVRSYDECFETARQNFSVYPRARLVRGKVPDTLTIENIPQVCYLSLDMNIAAPEIAALEFFWDKLVPGAPVIMDDYGWIPYKAQKEVLDAFAARKGVQILTLPTGQGLLLKPPIGSPNSSSKRFGARTWRSVRAKLDRLFSS